MNKGHWKENPREFVSHGRLKQYQNRESRAHKTENNRPNENQRAINQTKHCVQRPAIDPRGSAHSASRSRTPAAAYNYQVYFRQPATNGPLPAAPPSCYLYCKMADCSQHVFLFLLLYKTKPSRCICNADFYVGRYFIQMRQAFKVSMVGRYVIVGIIKHKVNVGYYYTTYLSLYIMDLDLGVVNRPCKIYIE